MPERSARSRSLQALLALVGVSIAGGGYPRATGFQAHSPQPSALILQQALDQYCVTCHNGRLKTAGLEIDSLDVDHVADNAQRWETIVTKLRTGEMPPPGRPRPDAATYRAVAAALER